MLNMVFSEAETWHQFTYIRNEPCPQTKGRSVVLWLRNTGEKHLATHKTKQRNCLCMFAANNKGYKHDRKISKTIQTRQHLQLNPATAIFTQQGPAVWLR
jgi:hypothetical protein